VQRFVDAANARDAAAMAALVAPDAVFECFPDQALIARGRDGILALYTRLLSGVSPDFRITVEPRIVEGNLVIDQEHFAGTPAENGRATWMYQVRGGLIHRAWALGIDRERRPDRCLHPPEPQGATPDWQELQLSAMERVALDRTSLQAQGSIWRADLRWHLVGTAGRLASYTVEDTEVDCGRALGRIRGRRRIQLTPHDGRRVTPAAVSPAEADWHSHGPGSLGREAWRRMCEFPMPGA